MTEIVALEALVARVTPGQSLAIPVDGSGVAMAATAALLDAGIRDLTLICVPISGRHRELADLAYAARRTLVTVERIVERNLLESEDSAAGVLPSLYIDTIAVAARGAWPLALWDEYPADEAEIARYAAMARNDEGF